MDDLPKCFKRPKDTFKTDLYLDNYFQCNADELYSSIKLREVLLTGNAVSKEIKFDNLSTKEKQLMLDAMKVEWSKWTEFNAYKKLPHKELKELLRRHPGIRPVGTRWVLTQKATSAMKARLVVQGCQEDKSQIRTDAPTGSRDALYLTLAAAAQSGWDLSSYDAMTAYLQSGNIERLLLLRMPAKNPPPGTAPGEIVMATGAIYGTRDAGRQWYLYAQKVFREHGLIESKLEKGLYFFYDDKGLAAMIHSHVDDFLIAQRGNSSEWKRIIASLEKKLHLKITVGIIKYCGRTITKSDDEFRVTQATAAAQVDHIEIAAARGRAPEDPLSREEVSAYRHTLGQLLWLAVQTRVDIACPVSLAARRTTTATVADAKTLNKTVTYVHGSANFAIVMKRNLVDLPTCTTVCFSDAAFANVDGVKSQWGMAMGITHHPRDVIAGRYDLQVPVAWHSGTIKRTVKSTLAAEGYATLEGAEINTWFRQLLTEAYNPKKPLSEIDDLSLKRPGEIYSDSNGLVTHIKSDCGQSTDKRFRIVAAMIRDCVQPNSQLKLTWIPTWSMVADSLTKIMEASILLAFFSAKKHSFGTRQPHAAMLASVLMTCISRVKGQPTPEPTDANLYMYTCYMTGLAMLMGIIIGFSIFASLFIILRQNTSMQNIMGIEQKADAEYGAHPGWDGRDLRRRSRPPRIPEDADGDVPMGTEYDTAAASSSASGSAGPAIPQPPTPSSFGPSSPSTPISVTSSSSASVTHWAGSTPTVQPFDMNHCVVDRHNFRVGHNNHSVYITCKTCRKHASWLRRNYPDTPPNFNTMNERIRNDLQNRWNSMLGITNTNAKSAMPIKKIT